MPQMTYEKSIAELEERLAGIEEKIAAREEFATMYLGNTEKFRAEAAAIRGELERRKEEGVKL